MNFGIIGTGGRSLAYLGALKRNGDPPIAAICDIDEVRLREFSAAHFPGRAPSCVTTDYRRLLAMPEIDAVLICTPDTTHLEIALAAGAAGKAILLEKPVATTMADALALQGAFTDYPKPAYLGFVLRYAPIYRSAFDLVRSGRLGDIVTIHAREALDPRHASSFFRRWHRFSRNNGGLMNAKCCHDLDLLNWMTGSDPVRVSAFGGRRVFTPRSGVPDRCRDCPVYDVCLYAFDYSYYRDHFGSFHSLSDLCVYNSEKDIVDHELMSIQYASGVVAQFELCLFGHEENRTMTIHGTRAVLEVDLLRQTLRFLPLRGEGEHRTFEGAAGGHGGGDDVLVADLIRSVETCEPINQIRAGCLATQMALAGEESMRSGKTVCLGGCDG
jgi:predicted dehydrogenase